MIIRIQLNDAQLAELLNGLGYKTDTRDVPVAVSRYHNQTEIENYPRLHVLDGEKWVEAHPFYELILDETLVFMTKIWVEYKKANI